MPTVKGKKEHERLKKGEALTRGQAIFAMCYTCTAGTGRGCQGLSCPLYPFMPYRKERPRKAVVMTDDEKKTVAERLRRGKDAKRRK